MRSILGLLIVYIYIARRQNRMGSLEDEIRGKIGDMQRPFASSEEDRIQTLR